MLYRINVPTCRPLLEWIVNLQRQLLKALCNPETTADIVDEDWVVEQLSELNIDEAWIRGFCNRKDQIAGISNEFVEHAKIIAKQGSTLKQKMLQFFENDAVLDLLFDGSGSSPKKLSGLTYVTDKGLVAALRGFFEIFYAPAIYRGSGGYIIPYSDGTVKRFDKDKFLEQFRKDNNDTLVCPMCDGSMNDPKIDHFFPKSRYPSLSCHPLNLIPICETCNNPTHKGQKVPLDLNSPNQVYGWYHPYLRSANQHYQIEFRSVGNRLIPELVADNWLDDTRLKNLEKLLKLRHRWAHELRGCIRVAQRTIYERRKRDGEFTSKEDLRKVLKQEAQRASYDVGQRPFSLLNYSYLEQASSGNPDLFDELWVYATNADPVSSD